MANLSSLVSVGESLSSVVDETRHGNPDCPQCRTCKRNTGSVGVENQHMSNEVTLGGSSQSRVMRLLAADEWLPTNTRKGFVAQSPGRVRDFGADRSPLH
jgi:hypothetical protein